MLLFGLLVGAMVSKYKCISSNVLNIPLIKFGKSTPITYMAIFHAQNDDGIYILQYKSPFCVSHKKLYLYYLLIVKYEHQ